MHRCRRTTALTVLRTRPISTSRSLASPAYSQTPTNDNPAKAAELLRDVGDLLRRYPLLNDTTWPTRLDQALVDLTRERRARIAVAGDKTAGTSTLVTALFDDPLSTDPDLSVALEARRLGDAPEAIALTYADKTRTSPIEIGFPSRWLRDNKADVVEIQYSDVPPKQSSVDVLHLADAAVLVVSELRLLSPPNLRLLLLELSGKPNLVLALNSQDPTHLSAARSIELELASLLPATERPSLVLVSTQMASEGLEALSPTDPAQTVSYEKFQTSYIGSGLPALQDVLASAVAGIRAPAENSTAPSALQLQTSEYVLDKAVSVIAFEGAKIEDDLLKAASDVAALSFVAQEAERKALEDLGVVKGSLKVPVEEVKAAKLALNTLFSTRLVWWKLPVRTDDLTTEIAFVADQSYLRAFEDRLIFDTGRLISLSTTLSRRTDDLLSSPAFSPTPSHPLSSLYSPLLLNRIAQSRVETRQTLSTDLSTALVRRRKQITAPGGPAEVLQSRAQGSVVSAATLSGTSVAGAVASQLLAYADLATNAGVGLLGTVLAAWILQRRWDKTRRKFFEDVEKRVTGGLEDDLGAAAQRIVDRSLFMTRTAVAGADELIRKRKAGFDAFARSLAEIERKRRG